MTIQLKATKRYFLIYQMILILKSLLMKYHNVAIEMKVISDQSIQWSGSKGGTLSSAMIKTALRCRDLPHTCISQFCEK